LSFDAAPKIICKFDEVSWPEINKKSHSYRMGNRLKSKTKEKAQDSLVEEKEEAIEVKMLIKDERTHKIFGALSLLLSFFLFVSFTSYLFTWKEDQDIVRNTGIKILFPNELEISNQLGSIGAYIAFLFFEHGFGVASFLFCSFFFVVGINLLFGKKVFSIWRNLRYVLVGIVVISVSASFFAGNINFKLGGAFGLFASGWLNAVIGKLVTASLIVV
jgi:S-DNA-T family DNA segregation ATPase FtsK/SpoIIIE